MATAESWTCPVCGNETQADRDFCRVCGRDRLRVREEPERLRRPRRRLSWLFGGGSLFGGTVAVVVAIATGQHEVFILAAAAFGVSALEFLLQRPIDVEPNSRDYRWWREKRRKQRRGPR